MTFTFDQEVTVRPLGDDRFEAVVTDQWNIGDNPNGGYLLSLIIRALAASLPHPDPLTITAHYLRRPELGPATITVQPLRAGRNLSSATVAFVQGGTERIRAVATFGDLTRSSGLTELRQDRPDLLPPEQCARRPEGTGPFPPAAELLSRVDVRLDPTTGWLHGEQSGLARNDGWTRFADGRPVDTLSLPLFADAFPPAVYGLVPAAWVPTVELTVHVRARPAEGWLQGSFETRYVQNGYHDEDGRLWDSSGRLVAQSRQLAVLLLP